MKTVAFFGHRYILNERTIEERLIKTLKDVLPQGFERLLIGCHGNFDNIALLAGLNYRNKIDRNIKIEIVLTNRSFLNVDKYGNRKVDFYKNNGCDTVFYDIEEVYFKNRIIYSNKKMVDESDLVICYVDMNSYKSGAKKAINYATKQKKPIINLFKVEDKMNSSNFCQFSI